MRIKYKKVGYKVFAQEEINFEVAGYEDDDGICFNVILMRKGE